MLEQVTDLARRLLTSLLLAGPQDMKRYDDEDDHSHSTQLICVGLGLILWLSTSQMVRNAV